MITLKNDRLEVSISERGAELRSIKLDGKETLWGADPAYWEGVAPVLFPVCGGFRDDKYTLDGKEYFMKKHGFTRTQQFVLEKSGTNFVTLLLCSNEETLKQYPFEFELRVTVKLRGADVDVYYTVNNLTDRTMYFSAGAHEAYACPEGIEDYDIIFPQKETLNAWELDGNLIAHKFNTVLKDSDTFPLYEKYFAIDALVFKDVKSRSATLRNRKTGRAVTVDFPGFDYLLLWTKPGAGYICIEPWCGIPGMVDDGYEIEKKEGIVSLEANGKWEICHTIHYA